MRIAARTAVTPQWAVVEFKDPTPISMQMCAPFLEERRRKQDALWAQDEHWSGGFYACAADGRLWAPSRDPFEDRLVRNWAHPETPAWAREWVRGMIQRRGA
jgi:hypothetical protein